jgi:hypothetical protein
MGKPSLWRKAAFPIALGGAIAACGQVSGSSEALDTTSDFSSEEVTGEIHVALEQTLPSQTDRDALGREVAVPNHLQDGQEFRTPLRAILEHGERLFTAVWTPQEGGGRPLTKGNGDPLADPSAPLLFPRNFNRISAMDANSCASCHNAPFTGGGGHFTTNAFIPGQRFDFVTFERSDTIPTKGNVDERGVPVTLITDGIGTNSVTNARATLGMFGSGYIEMLARQITEDLQRIRDTTPPRGMRALVSKGIRYGFLRRGADGSWDTSGVEGISKQSLRTTGPLDPPTLAIRPFHQQSLVVSIREFTNNAFNHHHGIQSTERFGKGTDPDGDGFTDELTRADVTAAALFQATLPVPGRVIPNDRIVERAVLRGEIAFDRIGCTSCHRTSLPLERRGWVYVEPNPFNPPKNLQRGEAPPFAVDLTSSALPGPRLPVTGNVVAVPAYTDLKLHDITTGPSDPNCEPIDMQENPTTPQSGSNPSANPAFFAGHCKFLTKKLWVAANEPPYFHHGKYTTLREAILAHAGEANASGEAFRRLDAYHQNAIIEFLKTLQVLPPGSRSLVVDERGRPKQWPPRG